MKCNKCGEINEPGCFFTVLTEEDAKWANLEVGQTAYLCYSECYPPSWKEMYKREDSKESVGDFKNDLDLISFSKSEVVSRLNGMSDDILLRTYDQLCIEGLDKDKELLTCVKNEIISRWVSKEESISVKSQRKYNLLRFVLSVYEDGMEYDEPCSMYDYKRNIEEKSQEYLKAIEGLI